MAFRVILCVPGVSLVWIVSPVPSGPSMDEVHIRLFSGVNPSSGSYASAVSVVSVFCVVLVVGDVMMGYGGLSVSVNGSDVC